MKLLIGFALSILATLMAAAAPAPPKVILDHRIPHKGQAGSVSAVTIYLRSEGDGPVYPRACYTQSVQLEKVSLDARSLVTANVLRSALKGWSCEEIMATTLQFSHMTSFSVSLSTD